MAILNVNLTRIESINLKKSLKTAQRGHKLLKDKLDELIKKILELVQENVELRSKADYLLQNAYQNFMLAKAVMGEDEVNEALIIPKNSVSVDIEQENIMRVKIPKFIFNEDDSNKDKLIYGFAYTTAELDNATNSFQEASQVLLELAQNEKSIELLATEIEKTRRRVNAIENVTIPNYIETIKYIGMKLSEDERAATSRLMKVKDVITGNENE